MKDMHMFAVASNEGVFACYGEVVVEFEGLSCHSLLRSKENRENISQDIHYGIERGIEDNYLYLLL